MGRITYLQHINHNMNILEVLAGLVAPHDCLGCGREGSLVCHACLAALPPAAVPLPSGSHLLRIRSATLYQGIAKDLLWKLKADGARAAAQLMAQQMAGLLTTRPDAVLVPVPTATSRVRQRGYDQAKLLARNLSRLTAIPCVPALARHGQTHQVGAHRHERLRQLNGAFRVKKAAVISRTHVILIDDVTTTGATLETAAKVLKQAGASSVESVTFAYAEKLSK